MTHNQLPPTELNPHGHIPNLIAEVFADPVLVNSLALNQDGRGENVVLRKYDHEPSAEQILTDVVGLIKAVGSEDSPGWTQDHRDAALTTVDILASCFEDVCSTAIEQRMWAASEYIACLATLPPDVDLNGAAYSLYELSEKLPSILGDTSTKEVSMQITMSVLCQWERLFGEQVSDDPAVVKRAKILAYSPHGQAMPGYRVPVVRTAETAPITDADIAELRARTFAGEIRDMLCATGDEQLILAAQKGDINTVATRYVEIAAPAMRTTLKGSDRLWQHSLTFDEAPGFYEAITRYVTEEWTTHRDMGLEDDPEIVLAELGARINSQRDTSQRPAMDITEVKRAYQLESDPYDLIDVDHQSVVDQARSYDALVDRIRELKDSLNLTTDQALEHCMRS